MLRRSTAYLPRELLNLVYTSVIRSHLEYCSGTFFNAAPTHLNKLDVVQKIASRIITGSSPQAHSAPLQLQLGLDLLQSRRKIHVVSLVIDILRGQSHPYLIELFQSSAMSNCTTIPNNKLANKRFSRFGTEIYNEYISSSVTLTRHLDPSLRGQSPSLSVSQMLNPASFPSSTPQQSAQPQLPGSGSRLKTFNR